MIGRLLKGLIFGLLIGGALAGILVKGLGLVTFATTGGAFAFTAFAAALVTGAIVGLVAGKPIWAEGAWIEGLLKTFFGALLGVGAMFLARKFGVMDFPFASLGVGSGPVGELPIVTLPAIATILSVFYELDNTDSAESQTKGAQGKGRVEKPAAKLRASGAAGVSGASRDEELDAEPGPAAKRAKK